MRLYQALKKPTRLNVWPIVIHQIGVLPIVVAPFLNTESIFFVYERHVDAYGCIIRSIKLFWKSSDKTTVNIGWLHHRYLSIYPRLATKPRHLTTKGIKISFGNSPILQPGAISSLNRTVLVARVN